MAPDLAQIGMTLILFGSIVMFAWAKPALHLTQDVLSFFGAAAHSLFAKGPRA
ncbi:hypothetical protein [Sphingomonas sp. MA1305]|uniref:hypothetical protein n=1 Tax=Sphingomonas sp. MA1305 TaxID=2479204 RepID=UPI0018DFC318|nr:hypothetical protein [Sphingomonas sp. MA1305]